MPSKIIIGGSGLGVVSKKLGFAAETFPGWRARRGIFLAQAGEPWRFNFGPPPHRTVRSLANGGQAIGGVFHWNGGEPRGDQTLKLCWCGF